MIEHLQGMKANDEEINEVETDEWYMRRMNAGLAHLQDICYCLAWLIMEDDGVSFVYLLVPLLCRLADVSLRCFLFNRHKRMRECFLIVKDDRSRKYLPF